MKEIKIKEEFEVGVKRFYLPVEIDKLCPSCNNKCTISLGNDYLSYPTLNTELNLYHCCDSCDTEFEFDIVLKMSIEIHDEIRKL